MRKDESLNHIKPNELILGDGIDIDCLNRTAHACDGKTLEGKRTYQKQRRSYEEQGSVVSEHSRDTHQATYLSPKSIGDIAGRNLERVVSRKLV